MFLLDIFVIELKSILLCCINRGETYNLSVIVVLDYKVSTDYNKTYNL